MDPECPRGWIEKFKLDVVGARSCEFLKKKIFLMFIYFGDRERQSMGGGGAGREGDTESQAGSRLPAASTQPDMGLELPNCEIMT